MHEESPVPQCPAADVPALRVLVIDDDGFMRAVVRRLLQRLGRVEVGEAVNGMDALAMIRQAGARGFDLLICDLDMPESDGMEFMRLLGAAGETAPVLILSGKSPGVLHSVEIMGGAYGLRILGAVQKPPIPDVLRDALQKCREISKPPRPPALYSFRFDELREGIECGQFEPFFQPKVNLTTRALNGCEALARWRHPRHGILPPGAFIDAVEAGGLMNGFTFLILRQAVAWGRRWADTGRRIPVSVNLSMSSFADPDLGERIVDIVRDEGLEASDVLLEITETIAMADVARCLETLVRLRLKGFGLAIDDFGTGFSSLQQLERVPYTELKIDRSFVRGAAGQQRLRTVLESSVSIARRLGLISVAEGVESRDDWACLREVGCDVAQGYYIAKPMCGDEILPWMESWRRHDTTAR